MNIRHQNIYFKRNTKVIILCFCAIILSELFSLKIHAKKSALFFRVIDLKVSGNQALSDDDVSYALDYKAGMNIAAEPAYLRKIRNKLEKTYIEKGYPDTKITIKIETTKKPGEVAVIVIVDEGKPQRYTKITLRGLPSDITKNEALFGTKLRGGMIKNRNAAQKAVREIIENIIKKGYIDARDLNLSDRQIKPLEYELTIPIDAGIKTQIKISGNTHARTNWLKKEINKGTGFKSFPSSVKESISKLVNYYTRKGYYFINVSAKRTCHYKDKAKKIYDYKISCDSQTIKQTIKFIIREGKAIEIAAILFEGIKHFETVFLEREIFAYMAEKLKSGDIFMPFNTQTVDSLGISDKRPCGMHSNPGLKVPWVNPAKIYVPLLYEEVQEHLESVYVEQGFLQVQIRGSCNLKKQTSVMLGKIPFIPFAKDGESNLSDNVRCLFINDKKTYFIPKFFIDEGPQTLMDEIVFEGNKIMTSRKLMKITALKTQSPYNEYKLRDAALTIEKTYRSIGYMFAVVKWEKQFSADMTKTKVVFYISEGPLVKVGKINITGALVTSKRLIKERLVFEHGDILTPENLAESRTHLSELGIFDSVTIEMIHKDKPAGTKDIQINIIESKPQYLELKWGLATVDGIRGGFEYGYINLAGWALNTRFRLRANRRIAVFFSQSQEEFQQYWESLGSGKSLLLKQIERHFLLGVGQPHFPGTRGYLGWNLDAVHERVNEQAFGATRSTVFLRLNSTISLGSKFRRGLALEQKTGIEHNDLEIVVYENQSGETINLSPSNAKLYALPEGTSDFLVTGLKITIDLRDNPFNPRKGFLLSISGDFVQSLSNFDSIYYNSEGDKVNKEDVTDAQLDSGDIIKVGKMSKLIRAEATLSGYIPVPFRNMTLSMSATAGFIFHLHPDSTAWADRYFYAGGVETLRGFREQTVVPEDIYQGAKKEDIDDAEELLNSFGGETMLIFRTELRYPITKAFFGALFYEMGNIWRGNILRDREKVNIIDTSPFKLHLRPVAGAGLRYLTPAGPVSFDLGINLAKRQHEERFAWFLSVGSAF